MKYKIIPTCKKDFAIYGLVLGAGTIASTPFIHRIPDTPELVQRVNDINRELNRSAIPELTLGDLAQISNPEGEFANSITQAAEYSKIITEEKAKIEKTEGYKEMFEEYTSTDRKQRRNIIGQGLSGLTLYFATLFGYLRSRKKQESQTN